MLTSVEFLQEMEESRTIPETRTSRLSYDGLGGEGSYDKIVLDSIVVATY